MKSLFDLVLHHTILCHAILYHIVLYNKVRHSYLVGLYAGEVGEYAGDVGEYAGLCAVQCSVERRTKL
jgi:hypothetical protein